MSSEQTVRSSEIPDLDLVFLGVEVLLTAWPHGDVLGELEPAVDAVARPERGGEDESRDEGRPPAVLQVLVQDIRRIGEEIRTKVLADVCQGELGGIFSELLRRVPPREVCVRLGEACFGEVAHHLGTRERFRQEDRLRVLTPDLGERPRPEAQRLGVWVVDAEDRHAVADPELDDLLQLGPQRLPGVRLEVDRVDVLILLGGVLGVLDRAVRPSPEPFRVLPDPGMIGRGLVGQIERDLEVLPARGLDEAIEIRHGAEPRLYRRVAARLRADRPRTAGIIRFRLQRVVPALAKAPADRMNRREIQHVEPHGPDVRQEGGCLVECRAALRIRAGGTRKHLVPRAETRAFAFNSDAENPVVPRRAASIGRSGHCIGQVGRQRRGHALADRSSRVAKQLHNPCERTASPSDAFDQASSLEQLARHILSSPNLRGEPMPPAREPVDPTFDRVLVGAEPIDNELCLPAIVPERRHRRFAPRAPAPAPIQQHCGKNIVPIRKHIRTHDHAFPNRPLDRKPPVVHRRMDVLDHDAALKLRIKMWHVRVRNSSKGSKGSRGSKVRKVPEVLGSDDSDSAM